MQKFTVNFFLFVYVLFSTHAVEVFKIPVLLEHYLEHKKENRGLAFSDFLMQHYSSQNASHAKDGHKNLPFKSIKENSFLNSFIIENLKPEIQMGFDDLIYKETKMYFRESYTFRFLHSIWQPPRC